MKRKKYHVRLWSHTATGLHMRYAFGGFGNKKMRVDYVGILRTMRFNRKRKVLDFWKRIHDRLGRQWQGDDT